MMNRPVAFTSMLNAKSAAGLDQSLHRSEYGVVDQNVDPAGQLHDAGQQSLDRIFGALVDFERARLQTAAPQASGFQFEPRQVSAGQ